MRERIHHAFIDRSLERNDEVRKVRHRLPAPLDEFGLMPAGRLENIDLAVVAGETQRVPLLRLAAILAFPSLLRDLLGQIVVEPLGDFGELLHRGDVGLLGELAQRRGPRVLAFVDAALRHLPHMAEVDVLRSLGAPADEHEALAVEHHGADAGAIGEGGVRGHARTLRHARPCAGHPRVSPGAASKTWMAGSSPAMTSERLTPGLR